MAKNEILFSPSDKDCSGRPVCSSGILSFLQLLDPEPVAVPWLSPFPFIPWELKHGPDVSCCADPVGRCFLSLFSFFPFPFMSFSCSGPWRCEIFLRQQEAHAQRMLELQGGRTHFHSREKRRGKRRPGSQH